MVEPDRGSQGCAGWGHVVGGKQGVNQAFFGRLDCWEVRLEAQHSTSDADASKNKALGLDIPEHKTMEGGKDSIGRSFRGVSGDSAGTNSDCWEAGPAKVAL